MPERATARDRLARILYMLPLAARDGGVRLDELANALGVSAAEILRDIGEVTAREYYHPAGTVDTLQIRVEEDRVRVWTPTEFRRPTRLSPREALALGLGLRVLAAEADVERRASILELATRLERALAVPELDTVQAYRVDAYSAFYTTPPRALAEPGLELELDGDGFQAAVADAARERRRCRISYLKPGAAAVSDRVIRPYVLAFAEGAWYVLAHDEASDERRVFRMDRILDAELADGGFDVPADFDPAAFIADGRVYRAEDDIPVRVRYSPRIARWLAERVECDPEPDGAVVVRHAVADVRWIVRHVLQYGAEAEILEPAEVRALAAETAGRLSA